MKTEFVFSVVSIVIGCCFVGWLAHYFLDGSSRKRRDIEKDIISLEEKRDKRLATLKSIQERKEASKIISSAVILSEQNCLADIDNLDSEIGKLKVELDFLTNGSFFFNFKRSS